MSFKEESKSNPSNKKMWSWALYDWANSAYSTTIMAGFFPVFFKQYWSQGADSVVTTARLGTVLSISSLLIAILSPLLGALSDQKGLKKFFCGIFMLVGVFSCFWMSFIPAGGWFWAMIAFGLGMFTFAASAVFYDALLPSVATDAEMDRVSSIGYALGYLGGGVLFALNVFMFLKYEWFGLSSGVVAVQISFFSVGVWWFLFSIPLFKNVPEPEIVLSLDSQKISTSQNQKLLSSNVGFSKALKKYLETLYATIKKVLANKNLLFFLLAYWLYIDGVYTVMTMAVDFGLSIGLQSKDLITALLLVQFIGFPTTWYFGNLADRFGSRELILFCIGIYSVMVCMATFMSEAWHFYALACVIGSVQGGVQSLSRSLFGRMIPKESAGEFLLILWSSLLGLFFMASANSTIRGYLKILSSGIDRENS